MIQFIVGMVVGAAIGVITMCLMIAASDADDEAEEGVYHICYDCKHKNVKAWDEPCDTCNGDHYEYEDE